MKLFITVFLVSLIVDVTLTSSPLNLTPVISTKNGQVQGKIVSFRGNDVYQFLGIPFAEPPIGELRFKRPVKAKPWSNVKSATEFGPACHQAILAGFGPTETQSEDCLSLNIFTTGKAVEEKHVDNKKRPVMVWIHGGGFNYGSANSRGFYDGTALTLLEDVVVVTLNYRVGAGGFLHLPELGIEGNMGLWDQNLALKWVKDNIDQFGGDPERVTIFGESAGSMSVSVHLVSPASKGLFKNAIMQSGSLFDNERWVDENVNEKFVSRVGCEKLPDVLACLQTYDISKFPDASKYSFWPTVGGEFFPENPEDVLAKGNFDSSVNILLGAAEKEGSSMLFFRDPMTFNLANPANLTLSDAKRILGLLFGKDFVGLYWKIYFKDITDESSSHEIRQRIADAYGDVILFCPTYMFGHDRVKHSPKEATGHVYAYYLSQKLTKSLMDFGVKDTWFGVTHADDIFPVFGKPFLEPEEFTQEDIILSRIMMETWGSFAREGKPPRQGPHEWLPMTMDNSGVRMAAMNFNAKAIGRLETKHLELCRENWPFPVPIPHIDNLQVTMGSLMKKNHDEL